MPIEPRARVPADWFSRHRRPPGAGRSVGFLHVGYPSVEISLAALRALTGEGASDGVDLVEVGHAVQRSR